MAKQPARQGRRVPTTPPKRKRAKRMAGADRKAMIIDEAARFFAEHGFGGATRDLADIIGIRQALIYKYFDSKEALVSAILDQHFDKEWLARLPSGDDVPATERLAKFFEAHAGDALRLRLFLDAALRRIHFPVSVIRAAGLEALL